MGTGPCSVSVDEVVVVRVHRGSCVALTKSSIFEAPGCLESFGTGLPEYCVLLSDRTSYWSVV